MERFISNRSLRSKNVLQAAWIFFFISVTTVQYLLAAPKFYPADHPYINYTGRIDFTNPKLPRFWQPGVTINVEFSGSVCRIILNDEELWNKNHNYIEVVVDSKVIRLQTKSKRDTIDLSKQLTGLEHSLLLCKNTEANIGYLEFVGLICENLQKPLPKAARKIEFIGNSITCGTGSDQSVVPCGKGEWHDQHNAYLSYGAVTARSLRAQFHLSSVSGIGLMHSCCNMDVVMPQVFDKISMRNNALLWDFSTFQPGVVTICLGQNDGQQDSTAFCDSYIAFIRQLRNYYPKASIICLSSPMADAPLLAYMKRTLTSIVHAVNDDGDKNVALYFFSKQYHHGCDSHPDLKEHEAIARELTAFIRKLKKW
jgi:hypothetical protein